MKKLSPIACVLVIFSMLIVGCDDTVSEDEFNITLGNSDGSFSEYSCPSQGAYEACQSKNCGECSHTSGPNLYQ